MNKPNQNKFGTTNNYVHIMRTVISFTSNQTVLEWTERRGEHIVLQEFTKLWSENQRKKNWFSILYIGCQQKLANSAVTLNCNLTANAQQW